MKRVIVTGATGMLGMALIRECVRQDVEVTAVVRPDSDRIGRLDVFPGICIAKCALSDLKELPDRIGGDHDVFFHLGWAATGKGRDKSVENQIENIGHTKDAVEAAAALGCRRFVGAGSQAEYGPLGPQRIRPDTPADPVTPYGICKLAAEQLSRCLCKTLGLEWVWPRIFSVYGPYDKPGTMISSALTAFLNGREFAFTKGENLWDYLYADDAGDALFRIGLSGKDGSVYLIGSGEGRPLKEYIREMAKEAGVSPTGLGERSDPQAERWNLCADIQNLKDDTGFTVKTSFPEGIRNTIRYLKSEQKE